LAFDTLDPRDAGFALAALALDGDASPETAARAPRGTGPKIAEALTELLSEGADAAKAKLGAHVDDLRRSGPGAVLATVHPTWLADALVDEPDETISAVLFCLPEAVGQTVRAGLSRLGRHPAGAARPTGVRVELTLVEAERFRKRVFPHAGGGRDPALDETAELRWLAGAAPEEIESAAREIGLRAVARAFCGISKEDLAKLCHGLPPADSVRLVSAVVELRDRLTPDDLRAEQKLHLKLLRAGGVSPALFADAGLSLLIGATVAGLPERARWGLALRLPDTLGRRVIDLSAPGALLDEAARAGHAKELPGWLSELQAKGVAPTYAK